MEKSSFIVLLLVALNVGDHTAMGQSTIGEYSNDEQNKYFSNALFGLANSMQSEFQNLNAQISRLENNGELSRHKLSGARCPNGFNYTAAGFPKCYAVLHEAAAWNTAQQKCRQLHKNAHLAVINGALEQQIISQILLDYDCLQTHYDGSYSARAVSYFWVGGQLQNISDCDSTYIWKPDGNRTSLPIGYDNWHPGEPNCAPIEGVMENCMGLRTDGQWNDLSCSWKFCSICEVLINI